MGNLRSNSMVVDTHVFIPTRKVYHGGSVLGGFSFGFYVFVPTNIKYHSENAHSGFSWHPNVRTCLYIRTIAGVLLAACTIIPMCSNPLRSGPFIVGHMWCIIYYDLYHYTCI